MCKHGGVCVCACVHVCLCVSACIWDMSLCVYTIHTSYKVQEAIYGVELSIT